MMAGASTEIFQYCIGLPPVPAVCGQVVCQKPLCTAEGRAGQTDTSIRTEARVPFLSTGVRAQIVRAEITPVEPDPVRTGVGSRHENPCPCSGSDRCTRHARR